MLDRAAALGCDEFAVDIGTGDGAYVLRTARAEPRRLVIGIDSNPEAFAESSRRAARKTARGGAQNALFAHASAEALPEALTGSAARVTILLPWGSLLRAVVEPRAAVLDGVRRLSRDGAHFEIVLGYEAQSDPKASASLPELTHEHFARTLLPRYHAAGFDARIAPVSVSELRALGTRWASRLAFGRERRFWRITATATGVDG